LHNYLVDAYIGVERRTIAHERLFVHEMGWNVCQSLKQTDAIENVVGELLSGTGKYRGICNLTPYLSSHNPEDIRVDAMLALILFQICTEIGLAATSITRFNNEVVPVFTNNAFFTKKKHMYILLQHLSNNLPYAINIHIPYTQTYGSNNSF
jgi:hypothetical protein